MGSLFGGGGGGSTTSSQIATLPSWIQGPMRDLVTRTQSLSNTPYNAYQGQRYQDFSVDELNAFDMTRNMLGFNTQPSQDISSEVARRGLEGFSQSELQPYMNPYIENVLDINRNRQFENFDRTMADYRGRAAQAGAFGGSRFGLGEAQMSQDFQEQLANYDQQGLFDTFNQGLSGAMQGTQLAGQSGMDLANLQGLQQQGGFADINALMGIGGQQRAFDQQGLDFNYEEFNREQAHPYQQLQFASGIYNPIGSLMRGSETTQTQPSSGGSGFLGTALGLGSMALGFPGISSAIGGSALGGSFGGSIMGGVTGRAAGLGNSQISRMVQGGSLGMYGPGFADGGLVTRQDDRGEDFMQGIAPMAFANGGYVPQVSNGGDPFGGIQPLPMPQLQPMVDQQEQEQQSLEAILQGLTQRPSPTPSINPSVINEFPENSEQEGYRSMLQRLWDTGIFGQERDGEGAEKLRNEYKPKDLKKNKKYDSNAGATDVDMMVRVLAGEARGEPKDAQIAVANVVKNRSKEKGMSVKDVILKPKQFSAFNKDDPNYDFVWGLKPTDDIYKKLKPIAEGVLKGKLADPTGGATHYYNPSVVTPAWDSEMGNRQKIGSHLFGNTAYADGGQVTPFQQAIQRHVKDPLQAGLSGLTQQALNTTQNVQDIGQFFTQPSQDYYANEPTVLDTLVENARLENKARKLEQGSLPQNLQHMMNQVSPLATANAGVKLDPLNNQLMVTPSTQPVDGTPGLQKLQDAVKAALSQKETTSPSQQATAPTPKETPKEKGMNIPLMMFGAQLLSSNRGFKHALGDAAKTGLTTKIALDQQAKDNMRAQAQQQLAQRNSDLQAQRVDAEMVRLQAEAPYMGILQELKYKQALKDISGEPDLQKAIDNLAKVLLETSNISAEQAYAEASKVILSNRVGENLNNGKPAPKAISIEEYLK